MNIVKKICACLLGIILAAVSSVYAASVPGVFLQDGGWLWMEQQDGVMSASVKIDAGTAVDVEVTGEKDLSGAGGRNRVSRRERRRGHGSHRRAGVHHQRLWVSGDADRSQLRGADRAADVSADRKLRRDSRGL